MGQHYSFGIVPGGRDRGTPPDMVPNNNGMHKLSVPLEMPGRSVFTRTDRKPTPANEHHSVCGDLHYPTQNLV
jgi:hypothetical protein